MKVWKVRSAYDLAVPHINSHNQESFLRVALWTQILHGITLTNTCGCAGQSAFSYKPLVVRA